MTVHGSGKLALFAGTSFNDTASLGIGFGISREWVSCSSKVAVKARTYCLRFSGPSVVATRLRRLGEPLRACALSSPRTLGWRRRTPTCEKRTGNEQKASFHRSV